MPTPHINRRNLILGAAGLAALGTVGSISTPAHAVGDGHGLKVLPESGPINDRLQYFRFRTSAISWNPGVNILLPEGYHSSGKRYPVIYLHHGGQSDFIAYDKMGVQQATAGLESIIVMPDGGQAGWFGNPVASVTGPKNWETFHMSQLLPWVDDNFRTFAEYDGRAVAGYSMGGFGAMKYAAKYYGHFCSVSGFSGPTSLRRDGVGAPGWVPQPVVQWMQASSAVDLGIPGGLYGIPWHEARVSADNPVERIESYRNKRVFMNVGTQEDLQEPTVLAGNREFKAKLDAAGIPNELHEVNRTHQLVPQHLWDELGAVTNHLRTAG